MGQALSPAKCFLSGAISGTNNRFVLLWVATVHIPDGFLSTPVWAALDAVAAPVVGGVELIDRAESNHIMAYLVKPIKLTDLERTVALAQRRFEQYEALRR